MIRCVVGLTGTASPRPIPATAVLMPTTRPRESASAPPELPGLRAASVWMTSSMIRADRRPRAGRLRPRPLTTPAVTLPARPSGLPTATTSEPTTSRSASPYSGGLGTGRSARMTARSDKGSRPTTSKRAVVPSAKAASPAFAVPDHVGVGDEMALVAEDDGGAGRLAALPADPERGHPRGQRLGDADDDRRVGVEGAVVLHVVDNAPALAGVPLFAVGGRGWPPVGVCPAPRRLPRVGARGQPRRVPSRPHQEGTET